MQFLAPLLAGAAWAQAFDADPLLVSFFQGGKTQWDGVDDLVDSAFDFPFSTGCAKRLAEAGSFHTCRICSVTTISIRIEKDGAALPGKWTRHENGVAQIMLPLKTS